MKLLIDLNELSNYKSRDKIPLECKQCKSVFYMKKHHVQCSFSEKSHSVGNFCSRKCSKEFLTNKIEIQCNECLKVFKRIPSQTKYNKKRGLKRCFCSNRCTRIFYNKHKTSGTNRSKLEKWIENQLKNLYPNLNIEYNNKELLQCELDIYIPSLKLAFELNGIFHYEDIFGQLEKTQRNDKRKFQACLEKGIGLCIIDTSKQKYFKEKTSKEFLDIITSIINKKMEESIGIQPNTN